MGATFALAVVRRCANSSRPPPAKVPSAAFCFKSNAFSAFLLSPRGVLRAAGMPESDHVWEDRGGAFCRWSNGILIFSRFPGLFGNDI